MDKQTSRTDMAAGTSMDNYVKRMTAKPILINRLIFWVFLSFEGFLSVAKLLILVLASEVLFSY